MRDYDVKSVQVEAARLRGEMIGQRYRHYRGGDYRVTGVDVDEATGLIRVSYQSEELGYVWSRTLANFTEQVAVQRFTRLGQ